MKPKHIFNEITSYCEANHNQANIDKYLRYFREGFDSYGLERTHIDHLVNTIVSKPGINLEEVRELSLLLVKSPKYEMTVIAIRLLLNYKKEWNKETFKTVEKWFSLGITNWAETDYICGELMNLFFKQKLITIETISKWRTARNKFQRRAAAVSLIKPMKLSTDFQPYFEFIDPMMTDDERVVHQGLGWFLREAWKKQPEPTETFLMKWKNTAARLIFQYATEKMTAEGKLRFRKEK